MPSTPRNVERLNATEMSDLLWQAGFGGSHQRHRSKWLQVDLRACVRTLKRQLRESDGGHHGRGRRQQSHSLQYMSSLFLGLCRIMSYQLSRTYANFSRLSDLSRLLEQIEQRARNRKATVANLKQHEQPFRNDPLMKAFMAASEQFEQFNPPPPTMTSTADNLSCVAWPSEQEQPTSANDDVVQADRYFEQLYDQMDGIDFIEEFQDVLESHFGAQAPEPRNSARFSDLHALDVVKSPSVNGNCKSLTEQLDNMPDIAPDVYAETHVQSDIQTEFTDGMDGEASGLEVASPNPDASPVNPRRRRRTRRLMRKRPRKGRKKLFGLKRFAEEWRKSKVGYQWLARESTDSTFTEPSRSLPTPLKTYFKAALTEAIDNIEQMALPTIDESPIQHASLLPEHFENYTDDDGNQYGDSMLEMTEVSEKLPEQSHSSPSPPAQQPEQKSAPKLNLNREKMVDLLNKALHSLHIDSAGASSSNASLRVPFASLLSSMPIEPTRQMAAQSFFTLLHLTAAAHPNEPCIELHQQPLPTPGTRRSNKILSHFAAINVELK